MQILKDIYLTSGLPYGFHPNAYAVKGPRGVVLQNAYMRGLMELR